MLNTDNIFELAYLIFNAYIEKHNLSFSEMGSLIERFKLVSFISDNEDYLNSMGIQGGVEEVEDYLKLRMNTLCPV